MNTNVARFRYHGTGGSLFGLVLVNGILSVITVGIYSFWAKTKVRQFHYSHTEMDGERFAYHGTGGELFRGYLKVIGAATAFIVLLLLLAVLIQVLGFTVTEPVRLALTAVFWVVVPLLVAAAVNGARRYRLSRSSWRGIRFSYHGVAREYVALVARGTLLSVITLGFYAPYFENALRAFLVTHARYGSEPFMYDGDGRELFREYVKAFLLTIPTLGIYWMWYAAFKHRYLWNHTAMRGARFRSTVAGGQLFGLYATNLLLVVLTLGIGSTWASTRTHAFWCERISLHGTVDWASIRQQAQTAGAAAEGAADALDVDVGLGM